MCIINHILFHMHWCVNWCNKTWSTLCINNWLNGVCHCSCRSHTLTFISTTLTCISLNHICHSSQITSQAAFTSAPFWRRIPTTSLCPLYADVNKGVVPSWGINHGEQMQKHRRGGSPNKCWTPYIYSLLFSIQENANTALTASKHTHLPNCSRKHMLFVLTEHIEAQLSQKMSIAWDIWQKQCFERHSLLSKKVQL